MSDEIERDASRAGRVTVSQTVTASEIGGETNFLNAEIDIEVSGAAQESKDVTELQQAIVAAVQAACEDFEATEYDEGQQ
jgi:hypothetical protein